MMTAKGFIFMAVDVCEFTSLYNETSGVLN